MSSEDEEKTDDQKLREVGLVMKLAYTFKDRENELPDLVALANPKHGTLKYKRGDSGEELYAAPGERFYSTAMMTAFEYYNSETNKWESYPREFGDE